MIRLVLEGGDDGRVLKILESSIAPVGLLPVPPRDWTPQQVGQPKQLQGLFTADDGTSSMNVDGSVTAIEFKVPAVEGEIRWVEEMRMVFHSTNMSITTQDSRRFGPVVAPGLPNGVRLTVDQRGVETDYFTTPVQVIGEFYRYARTNGGGVGLNAAVINDPMGVAVNVDLLIVAIDFIKPIGLFPGSADHIAIHVEDDLTGLQLFEAQFGGWRELVEEVQ